MHIAQCTCKKTYRQFLWKCKITNFLQTCLSARYFWLADKYTWKYYIVLYLIQTLISWRWSWSFTHFWKCLRSEWLARWQKERKKRGKSLWLSSSGLRTSPASLSFKKMIVICKAPFGWWSTPAIQGWPVFWRECCFWSVRWFVGWSQFVPRWSGRWSRSRQSDCRTFRSVPIWDLGLQWLQNGRNLGILLFVNLWYFVQGKLCSSHQISHITCSWVKQAPGNRFPQPWVQDMARKVCLRSILWVAKKQYNSEQQPWNSKTTWMACSA